MTEHNLRDITVLSLQTLVVSVFSANLFAENSKKIAGKVEKQMTEIKDSISSSHQTNSYWLRTIPTTQYQLIHLPAWRQSNPIPSGQSSMWVQKRGKVGGSWCRWSSCQPRTWYLSPPWRQYTTPMGSLWYSSLFARSLSSPFWPTRQCLRQPLRVLLLGLRSSWCTIPSQISLGLLDFQVNLEVHLNLSVVMVQRVLWAPMQCRLSC